MGASPQEVSLDVDDDSPPCPKCAAGTHPFKCWVCEHPGSDEYYRTKASIDQICLLVVAVKLCNKHAQEFDELQQKLEIEKAVA